MVIIFIFSSIPVDLENIEYKQGILYLKPEIQNLLHVPVFALLSLLWIITYRQRGNVTRKSVLRALCITIFYGFVDEYHQYYVPGRFMSVIDICFDIVGSFLGVTIYCSLYRAKISWLL
jgi:VanZ family protein